MPCNQNTDPLKLVREGTSQDNRLVAALDPAFAAVNDRTPAHQMVFAQAYAGHLTYHAFNNKVPDNWQAFFSTDVSVQFATAAIQNVELYSSRVKESFQFLNNLDNQSKEEDLRKHLGYLFSSIGSLARSLDVLKEKTPGEFNFSTILKNAAKSGLATGLQRLIGYFKAGNTLSLLNPSAAMPNLFIFGSEAQSFETFLQAGLSKDWITNNAPNWKEYRESIAANPSAFGSGSTFESINHLATHNLFTTVFDQFLKTYARLVAEAKQVLEASFTKWDNHAPHYALFLAFLRLQEYARQETNTLTQRHLDFYYRRILQLQEKPAAPSRVHLLAELTKVTGSLLLKKGMRFIAGKDVFFSNDEDFVANQAKVGALKKFYRHNDPNETLPDTNLQGRLFAAPIANSDHGDKPELTSVDNSWHPFYNKVYKDGTLDNLNMPLADIGFALASHYLFLAEGDRKISVNFTVSAGLSDLKGVSKEDFLCYLTTAEGWLEKPLTELKWDGTAKVLQFKVVLTGADPSIASYVSKTHGYTFATANPVLLVKVRHLKTSYAYGTFEDVEIGEINVSVDVTNLKTLSVSNDFGPVDLSKPFQPYGPSPLAGNAVVIGSKEVFQKSINKLTLNLTWLKQPKYHKTAPAAKIEYLKNGQWTLENKTVEKIDAETYDLTKDIADAFYDFPDPSGNEAYSTKSKRGFVRLKVTESFGQAAYQEDLIGYLHKDKDAKNPGEPPSGPSVSSLSLDYIATQRLTLNSADKDDFLKRQAMFFHVAPFGFAEQHPFLLTPLIPQKIFLLPQFAYANKTAPEKSAAEFYIGLTGLKPPQNVSLLFQVMEGTANPRVEKPQPTHLRWSYLQNNQWLPFEKKDVSDGTDGLLNSGLVSLAVPRQANSNNTLLPDDFHWIRISVSQKPDAVSRLLMVAAQGFSATCVAAKNNTTSEAAPVPAGTISKAEQPEAAIKKIEQPFASFGGRAKEEPTEFYTRISERLRHKDRAIALWDCEKLVLEAFPQVYRIKCLNHTQYTPQSGSNPEIYKELAPGHVTIVVVPKQHDLVAQDPLKPFASLGLLKQIDTFLEQRSSCFVTRHVINPIFEELKVSCNIRLHPGFDESFYTVKLQEAITRYLSPWAFSSNSSPSFGGKILQSALLNFVEEQPYVDYVTDFHLTHLFDHKEESKPEITGSKAISILVSVPAHKHSITILHPAEDNTRQEKCTCQA